MVGNDKKKNHDHLHTTGIKTKTPPSQCPNPKQNINMNSSTSTTRARAAEGCGCWPAIPQHLTLQHIFSLQWQRGINQTAEPLHDCRVMPPAVTKVQTHYVK